MRQSQPNNHLIKNHKIKTSENLCTRIQNWICSIAAYINYSLYCFIVLTSTPDPRIPPKYQTCSVIFSFSTDVPPGKKSKMLHSIHTMDRGSRLMPRHLAKPPEHILTCFKLLALLRNST